MSESHGRLQVVAVIPTIRPKISRVQWKIGGKALPGQHDEWRARATHMIDAADGIPDQRKARMIAVIRLLASDCDVDGNLQMIVANMIPKLLRHGIRLGEKTIRRALGDLEAYGYVEIIPQARIQGKQKCNRYSLQPFLDAAENHFQTTPEKAARPRHGAQAPKHGHPVQTVVKSSQSKRTASSTVTATPIRTPAPSVAAAITFTSPAKAPAANPPNAARVEALRSVGMSNPEVLALRWEAIPEPVFVAKISQAQSKTNPPGYLRNALDGILATPTPTIQPAPASVPYTLIEARGAAGQLYGVAVNGQPISRDEAIRAMRQQDVHWQISENLSDEARSLLPEAVYALLSDRGYLA